MIVSSKTPELRRIVQPLKSKIIFISAKGPFYITSALVGGEGGGQKMPIFAYS